jgi:hypothetical protein
MIWKGDCEWLANENLEGGSHDLLKMLFMHFPWVFKNNDENPQVSIDNNLANIWNGNFLNMIVNH